MKTERHLQELGIELPKATSPMANYVNAVRADNLLFLAGKGPGLPGHHQEAPILLTSIDLDRGNVDQLLATLPVVFEEAAELVGRAGHGLEALREQ